MISTEQGCARRLEQRLSLGERQEILGDVGAHLGDRKWMAPEQRPDETACILMIACIGRSYGRQHLGRGVAADRAQCNVLDAVTAPTLDVDET